MKKLTLAGLFLSTTMLAATAQAEQPVEQPAPAVAMSEAEWSKIRSFLDQNPQVKASLVKFMETTPAHNQEELDRAYLTEHADLVLNNPMDGVLGNPEGSITIVKFSDFRCGHCRTSAGELEELIASNDQIRVVVKEFPILGEQSVAAAKFALAVKLVGSDADYAIVKKRLFSGDVKLTPYGLIALSDELEADSKAIFETMESDTVSEHLAATAQMARDLKINGTPALIFNDVVVRGGLPLDAMQQAIQELY